MWRYDAGRTAASPAALPKELTTLWVAAYTPREPVWDDTLNRDLMPYDRIVEPVVQGKTLFIGFNDSDKIIALNTETGEERWRFYVDGPVRLPPVAALGKVYVASDDGYLYCLNAGDGSRAWKFRGGPSDRKVLGNKRLVSMWPARGGPVLRNGTIYFAASIWPFMGTFIYALDAETGQIEWRNDGTGATWLQQPHNFPAFAGVAPQGAFVATRDKLLIPGGRSVPACFDRSTGRQLYYHLARYGKMGGSSVFATDTVFFGHVRGGKFYRFDLDTGLRTENAGDEVQPVLTKDAFYFLGRSVVKRPAGSPKKKQWELKVDATRDLIKAGDRLYAAGKDGITAIQLPEGDEEPAVAWRIAVVGGVDRLIAADDKLFAVTASGTIMAFGAAPPSRSPVTHRRLPVPPGAGTEATASAESLFTTTGVREGYAVVYGAGNGNLVEALACHSTLHIVVVEPDAAKIDPLRRRYDRTGLYGRRIALLHGDLTSVAVPSYCSSLTLVREAEAAGFRGDPDSVQRIYRSLRPYGGVAVLPSSDRLSETVTAAGLPKAKLVDSGALALLLREGSLEGAGIWTHQYGSMANTITSDDTLVKLPLGILWFGGNSNEDVLPRHGHGPPEQVIGGRLFIEGMDCISARDVYTGRVMWKTRLPNLNKLGVYFDETYKDTPLSTAYNQVHIPGANLRGTNFVATADRVYVVHEGGCRVLDAATGAPVDFLVLPAHDGGAPAGQWAYIGIAGDALIGGEGFSRFSSSLELPHQKKKLASRNRWRFSDYDRGASKGLVVMDRYSGEVRWGITARHGFLHNAIAAGEGTLFCLDKLPPLIERRLARRGGSPPKDYRLLALDLKTGAVRWERESGVFGTWLGVSEEHDVLLQSTRPSNDAARGEDGKRMIVYHVATGEVVWDRKINYGTPPIIHRSSIVISGKFFDLMTGNPLTRSNPLTGRPAPVSYVATKGCNYPIASEHLITFRSSSAGFYDPLHGGGTGHFGGFKSGCTSNLIAADGVLNAPDYTRTCSCSFQNQTSLALTHMPDVEIWTHNDFTHDGARIKRVGINFGAPGDRRASNGTLWLDHPSVGGPSPEVPVSVKGSPTYFRHHASYLSDEEAGRAWIGASGVAGARTVSVQLIGKKQKKEKVPPKGTSIGVADKADDAEEDASGSVNLASSDLELTTDKTKQIIGIRFQDVEIPPGGVITKAYLQFKVDEATTEATRLTLHGQAADTAASFAANDRDISSRPRTKASVTWKPKPWRKVGEAGIAQRSPDVAAILGEIVNRPGWRAGNAVAFLITGSGKRVAQAFDRAPRGAPVLVFELENSPRPPPPAEQESAGSDTAGDSAEPYTVRLYLAEPEEEVPMGQRVFAVALQGETVLEGMDITAETGGARQTLVREFREVPLGRTLTITLTPLATRAPVLSGLEVIAE